MLPSESRVRLWTAPRTEEPVDLFLHRLGIEVTGNGHVDVRCAIKLLMKRLHGRQRKRTQRSGRFIQRSDIPRVRGRITIEVPPHRARSDSRRVALLRFVTREPLLDDLTEF